MEIDRDTLLEWILGQSKSPSCPRGEAAFGMRIMNHIERMPTVEPDKRWSRLMMYLADLQLTYAPHDGHGDKKLYMFLTGLIAELESWTGGGSDGQTDRR